MVRTRIPRIMVPPMWMTPIALGSSDSLRYNFSARSGSAGPRLNLLLGPPPRRGQCPGIQFLSIGVIDRFFSDLCGKNIGALQGRKAEARWIASGNALPAAMTPHGRRNGAPGVPEYGRKRR
jgi:hypothetical protein